MLFIRRDAGRDFDITVGNVLYRATIVMVDGVIVPVLREVIYAASVSKMIRKEISSGALSHSSLVSTLGVRHCFALFRSVR